MLAQEEQAERDQEIITDPVSALERMHKDGDNIYDAAITVGLEISAARDERRWQLARLAELVGKEYGQDRLGKFANAINERADNLREWRQVLVHWGKEFIADWRANFEILRYTHFRLGMRLAEDKQDYNAGLEFLDKCVSELWHVGRAEIEAAKLMGKHVGPHKLAEATFKVQSIQSNRVTLEIDGDETLDTLRQLREKKQAANLKVFEIEPEIPNSPTQ